MVKELRCTFYHGLKSLIANCLEVSTDEIFSEHSHGTFHVPEGFIKKEKSQSGHCPLLSAAGELAFCTAIPSSQSHWVSVRGLK